MKHKIILKALICCLSTSTNPATAMHLNQAILGAQDKASREINLPKIDSNKKNILPTTEQPSQKKEFKILDSQPVQLAKPLAYIQDNNKDSFLLYTSEKAKNILAQMYKIKETLSADDLAELSGNNRASLIRSSSSSLPINIPKIQSPRNFEEYKSHSGSSSNNSSSNSSDSNSLSPAKKPSDLLKRSESAAKALSILKKNETSDNEYDNTDDSSSDHGYIRQVAFSIAEISDPNLLLCEAINISPFSETKTETTYCHFNGKIEAILFKHSSESDKYVLVETKYADRDERFYIDLSAIIKEKETILPITIAYSPNNNDAFYQINYDGTIDDQECFINEESRLTTNIYQGKLIIINNQNLIKVTHSLDPDFNIKEAVTNKKMATINLAEKQIDTIRNQNENLICIRDANNIYLLDPCFIEDYSDSEDENYNNDKNKIEILSEDSYFALCTSNILSSNIPLYKGINTTKDENGKTAVTFQYNPEKIKSILVKLSPESDKYILVETALERFYIELPTKQDNNSSDSQEPNNVISEVPYFFYNGITKKQTPYSPIYPATDIEIADGKSTIIFVDGNNQLKTIKMHQTFPGKKYLNIENEQGKFSIDLSTAQNLAFHDQESIKEFKECVDGELSESSEDSTTNNPIIKITSVFDIVNGKTSDNFPNHYCFNDRKDGKYCAINLNGTPYSYPMGFYSALRSTKLSSANTKSQLIEIENLKDYIVFDENGKAYTWNGHDEMHIGSTNTVIIGPLTERDMNKPSDNEFFDTSSEDSLWTYQYSDEYERTNMQIPVYQVISLEKGKDSLYMSTLTYKANGNNETISIDPSCGSKNYLLITQKEDNGLGAWFYIDLAPIKNINKSANESSDSDSSDSATSKDKSVKNTNKINTYSRVSCGCRTERIFPNIPTYNAISINQEKSTVSFIDNMGRSQAIRFNSLWDLNDKHNYFYVETNEDFCGNPIKEPFCSYDKIIKERFYIDLSPIKTKKESSDITKEEFSIKSKKLNPADLKKVIKDAKNVTNPHNNNRGYYRLMGTLTLASILAVIWYNHDKLPSFTDKLEGMSTFLNNFLNRIKTYSIAQ